MCYTRKEKESNMCNVIVVLIHASTHSQGTRVHSMRQRVKNGEQTYSFSFLNLLHLVSFETCDQYNNTIQHVSQLDRKITIIKKEKEEVEE